MKKLAVITGLLLSTVVAAGPARADYYNQNCSSYGSYNSCSGYDSYGGSYNSQGSQIGGSYYGSERYSSGQSGYDYNRQYNRQQIGNTTYENNYIRTPYGNYNVSCTQQQVGSYVYTNCR